MTIDTNPRTRSARWANGLIIGGFVFDLLVVLPFVWHLHASGLEGWRFEIAEFLAHPPGLLVGFAVAFGPIFIGILLGRARRRPGAGAGDETDDSGTECR